MATLICNTFSGWNTNVVGAEQIACTPLPNGSECQAYSAPAPAVDSGKNYAPTSPFPVIDTTPFTWTVDSGTLPPGLSLSSGGAITGTPTAAGTYNFTLRVVDSTGLTATQAQTITISPGCAQPPRLHRPRRSISRSRRRTARIR
jgi:Putative Ig domain